jgi:hypothetical protein
MLVAQYSWSKAMKRFIVCLIGMFALTTVAEAQNPPTVSGLVHLEGIGDSPLVNAQWAGTKGQSRRLEGVELKLSPTLLGALRIEYLCHLENWGDLGPVVEGVFCGTRGQSRRLEAIQIRLAGPAAQFFTIKYECHLQGTGDVGPVADFATCGTRGQSRRLEALRVWIEHK